MNRRFDLCLIVVVVRRDIAVLFFGMIKGEQTGTIAPFKVTKQRFLSAILYIQN